MRHEASAGVVKKKQRISDADKLRLLKEFTQYAYENSESWKGELGMDLAYLCHAVLNDEQVQLESHSCLCLLLNEIDPDGCHLLRRYFQFSDVA